MIITKEYGEQIREFADIAASKFGQLSDPGLLCHSSQVRFLSDIAREGIIANRFAQRIHSKGYHPFFDSPQNQEYVSVSKAWGDIYIGYGDILLFFKTTKPLLDISDTEYYTGLGGVEFLIKRRVSPRELVGVCWIGLPGGMYETFERTFGDMVGKLWVNKPELAIPIYQCDLPGNLDRNTRRGLSEIQKMKVLWPTREYPEWLNWR